MTDCIKCNKRPVEPGRSLCSVCASAAYSNIGFHSYETEKGYRVKSIHQNRSYEPIHMNQGKSTAISSRSGSSRGGKGCSSSSKSHGYKPPQNKASWSTISKPPPALIYADVHSIIRPQSPRSEPLNDYKPKMDVEGLAKQPLAPSTLLIKKLDKKLMPTDIFHAVLDDRRLPNIPIYDRILALYKRSGYSILEEKIEGIDLRTIDGDGNAHAVTFCEEYILPHKIIDNIIANNATLSFIIMRTQRDRALMKVNHDRIARRLWHSKKQDKKIWLIFSGTPSSLGRIETEVPTSTDLATFQLLLTLVAIKKTLIEEGKTSAEKALDDLQDELRSEIALISKHDALTKE